MRRDLPAYSGNKTRTRRITNLLLIRRSKCFDSGDENENEVALRTERPGQSARSSEQNVPYRKPALRSEAFARALIDAKACLNDSDTLLALFNDAAKKAAAVPREPFKEYWPYLQTICAWFARPIAANTRKTPDNALLWIVAALNYLIDPFDLIPDATPASASWMTQPWLNLSATKPAIRWTIS